MVVRFDYHFRSITRAPHKVCLRVGNDRLVLYLDGDIYSAFLGIITRPKERLEISFPLDRIYIASTAICTIGPRGNRITRPILRPI